MNPLIRRTYARQREIIYQQWVRKRDELWFWETIICVELIILAFLLVVVMRQENSMTGGGMSKTNSVSKFKYMIEVDGPSVSGITKVYTLSGKHIGYIQSSSELLSLHQEKWVASILNQRTGSPRAFGIGNTPEEAVSNAIAESTKVIQGLAETLKALGVDVNLMQETGNDGA